MHRVLKPGGSLLILESSKPENYIMRMLYYLHLYCLLIPIGGLLSGDFKAYRYLAKSSSNYYKTPELKSILKKHGFEKIHIHKFLFGAANLIEAVKG